MFVPGTIPTSGESFPVNMVPILGGDTKCCADIATSKVNNTCEIKMDYSVKDNSDRKELSRQLRPKGIIKRDRLVVKKTLYGLKD